MTADSGALHEEEEHEEHVNHEAWVIPYADMLTLLMALFLMLWAMSSVDLAKFEALAQGLSSSLGGGSSDLIQPLDADDGGPQAIPLDGARDGTHEGVDPVGDVTVDIDPVDPQVGPGPGSGSRAQRAEEALRRDEQQALARAAERSSLAEVSQAIAAAAAQAGLGDAIDTRQDARGLVVTIVSDRVLFAPGSATVQAAGREALAVVAGAIKAVDNPIAVEGHTDDRPISTAQFPSNWELSTARATTVLRELVDVHGIPADRLSAAGYADRRPAGDNATPQGRSANRRVELVILSQT